MNDFFNWSGTGILFQHHWVWMLIAAAIGIYIGWRSCETVGE